MEKAKTVSALAVYRKGYLYMTYTKAPWYICQTTGHRPLRLIRDENGYCVAEAVKPANSGAAYIDADANAALIAAAPDMLAALESASPWLIKAHIDGAFDGCALPLGGRKAWERIERAIAKAKGD
jgi:hypothetical protein